MTLLPRSLFGRTLLALAAGLALAQLGSAAIHLFDRGSSVYRLASLQIAARIGQAARILDRLPPAERHKVVEEISGRHLRVSLPEGPVAVENGFSEHDAYERQFSESLRSWQTVWDLAISPPSWAMAMALPLRLLLP